MTIRKYVSGIRPSGKLHLGNYLGAIKHWKELQKTGNCYWFVADLHGQHTPEEVWATGNTLEACGITHFNYQSVNYAALLKLAHELSFHAKTSRLKNMTQYKDKSEQEESTLALFAYPVLMAADILYHEGTHVPVGQDQAQHLEFVRELARATGRVEPVAVINPIGAKIMNLTNPNKKMSKSDPNPKSCIYLSDSADDIRKKIRGAVSTPEGINNLLDITKSLGYEFEYTGHNEALKTTVMDLIVAELGK